MLKQQKKWRSLDNSHASIQEQQLSEWYSSSLGQRLLEVERQLVARAISGRFGNHLLQLDSGLHQPLFEQRLFGCGTLVSQLPHQMACPSILADSAALPFEAESIDIILMHHSLDFCADPYRAVREASQTLKSGGLLIILGFNPLSFWGLRSLMNRHQQGVWGAHFLRSSRVADWMQLLNFSIERREKHLYSLPLSRPNWLTESTIIPQLQRLLLPDSGAIYLLVGCKQTPGHISATQPIWSPRVVKQKTSNPFQSRLL